ncbi:hypothetical protein CEXT_380651, partial [Caerostris extrusa]
FLLRSADRFDHRNDLPCSRVIFQELNSVVGACTSSSQLAQVVGAQLSVEVRAVRSGGRTWWMAPTARWIDQNGVVVETGGGAGKGCLRFGDAFLSLFESNAEIGVTLQRRVVARAVHFSKSFLSWRLCQRSSEVFE